MCVRNVSSYLGCLVKITTLFFLIPVFSIQTAFAKSESKAETGLFKPEIYCSRSFIHKEQVYPLDSSRKQDGEGLRFLFKKNSESENLLDSYQKGRRSMGWYPYVGSLGIATVIGGSIYAGTIEGTAIEQRNIRIAFLFGGLAIAAGSYWLSKKNMASNEKTLENAIDHYNDNAPESEKIRMNVAPLVGPDGEKGAMMQTEVGF